jgi:flagellar hook-associated protein 2
MTFGPTFQSTGIASGMNWGNLIDSMVSLESQPIALMQKKQSAYRSQVSKLGDIASKISALQSAASSLASNGVLAIKATTSNIAFTATPGSGAAAGSYSIEVENLATSAKALSNAYESSSAQVSGATLTLTVQGVTCDPIVIADGASLSSVADAINGAGLGVNAAVVSDGTSSYLSLTNRATGYPLAGTADEALRVDVLTTGVSGTPLSIGVTRPAQNAAFSIDGFDFARSSNTVADAIAGTTLALKAKTAVGTPEDLILENDVSGTAAKLRTFVDAYNAAMKLVQGDLAVDQSTDRSTTLSGDSTVRGLQADLQHLIVAVVPGGSLSSLADLGISTNRDGSLSLKDSVLSSALSRDPDAVNRLFSAHDSGIGALVKRLSDLYTGSVSGLLTTRSKSLNDSITSILNRIDREQARIDSYKATLTAQFTAMEETMSQWKSIGQYLTSQSSSSSSS